MTLFKFFTDVVQVLRKENVSFAVAGGLVASLYRESERLTKDVDFLIFAGSHTQKKAESIIKSFDLEPTVIRKADLEGGPMFAIKRKSSTPMMVCGRSEKKSGKIGLDFILPEMPWFQKALMRAQSNQIDFKIGDPVPCLTVEDMIIAKLHAFQNKPQRFQDLDDLQSMFLANRDLDFGYLVGMMNELELRIPKELRSVAPRELRI